MRLRLVLGFCSVRHGPGLRMGRARRFPTMSSRSACSTTKPAFMPISAARARSWRHKMAVEDFGGTVLGKPIEIVFARSSEQVRCRRRHRARMVRCRQGRHGDRIRSLGRGAWRSSSSPPRKTASRLPARSAAPPLPASPARRPKPPGSTTATRSPRALRRRWWPRGAIAGSSSPSTTPSAIRWRPMRRPRSRPPAARCWAACGIRSTPRISARICCRRRRPARRSWPSPMAAATWSMPPNRRTSSA